MRSVCRRDTLKAALLGAGSGFQQNVFGAFLSLPLALFRAGRGEVRYATSSTRGSDEPSMARLVRWVLLTALAGCGGGSPLVEYTRTLGPGVERNLAALPGIAERLRTLPPLDADGIDVERVVLDAFADRMDQATASLAYAEDLANPDELGYVWARLEGTGALNHCASALHRGHLAYDPAHPEYALLAVDLTEARERYPRCAGFRFLFAIRTLELLRPSTPVAAQAPFVPVDATLDLDSFPAEEAPKPAPVPAKQRRRRGKARPVAVVEEATPPERSLAPVVTGSHDTETRYLFDGGFVRAEVLVFELPAGTSRGGLRFSAQSSVVVRGRGDAVEADVTKQVDAALRQALARWSTGWAGSNREAAP